ncbi:MAG: MFS transporter [Synechococcaceae cyanobacterium ELA445]
MKQSLAALPREVWLMGWISLVNDSASELVYPLLPLYLTSVLMAGPRALGLIEGVAEATASLLKLVSGVLVDRTQRTRPWIVGGYGLAGLARPLIAIVSSWPGLLLLRFADRVGKGLRSSPRDALLAACTGPEQRGLAFGVHRAMDNAGAVIGPLLAALLLAGGVPLRQILLGSLLPGLVCLALALSLKERPRERGPLAVPAPRSGALEGRLGVLPPALRQFLGVVALFTLGNSSNLFLLLRARELGVPAAQVPLLWAGVSAVAMLFSAPLAGWSDRVGRWQLLAGGYGAYGLFYLLLGALQRGGGGLFLLFAFYGLFMAATEGVEKALVADLAPAGLRGRAFGWFNMTTGVVLLPASAGFGWLYQAVGPQAAFTFAASCSLAAALLMLVLRPGAVPS